MASTPTASTLMVKPLRYRIRWFAYVDLLGFTKRVQKEPMHLLMPDYAECIESLKTSTEYGQKNDALLSAWFSDTFIIYTRSDSKEHFTYLESAARGFFQRLTLKKIPARGCISHGHLYSQARKNVFIGSALIQAHQQCWRRREWQMKSNAYSTSTRTP
jgi:hypothetical protein